MSNEYTISQYEELFNELSNIKNDLINPNIKLADAIANVKRAKEINSALESILNEAEKQVQSVLEVDKPSINLNNINKNINYSQSTQQVENNYNAPYNYDEIDDEIPF